MFEILSEPWPWYIAGPIIGLTVPFLLLVGNKTFGISNSLRHACAACFPSDIEFFQYNWKKEQWIFFFATGIVLGGYLGNSVFANPNPIDLSLETQKELRQLGIVDFSGLLPSDIFDLSTVLSLQTFVFVVLGGFLVGFGTRYAGGCTSGHAIMGLSNLQWPSLIATIFFMLGGFVMTHLVFPHLFKLF